MMTNGGTFNSARALSEMVYKYVDTTSRELGRRKALDLLTEVCQALGTHQAEAIRQSFGLSRYDVVDAFALSKTVVCLAYGMELKAVEEGPTRIVLSSGKCPVYEACQLWGTDARSMCRAGPTRFMDAMLKQLNPDLSYQILKYRSSADDFCQAAIVQGEGYSFAD